MAEFQIGSAFVRIGAQLDQGEVNQQTNAMGGRLAAWAGGLGLGAIISKGIADGLNIKAANTKLSAQMGLTTAEAKKAGDTAGSVYRDGFGASIEDVNGAIKGVGQNMKGLKEISQPELDQLTKGALGISEAFDVDVNESTRAAGALMKSGLAKDGQEALDIITKGFQSGMDSSGDWLDTLNEYSPQFAKIGIDGPDALNLISQFMKAGVRDTDAAADAIKEFGLRAIDTGEETTQAYDDLGLNADEMRKKIAAGGPAGAKAMQQVFDGLQKVKDPVKQNQIGTALMGTQWEDTVRAILPEIDLTKDSIGDVAGSTDEMNKKLHDTPQAKLEQLKRQAEGLVAKVVELPGPFGEMGAAVASFGPQGLQMGASIAMIGMALGPTIASTWAWTAALLANPTTWIVIGIIALVAAIVLIATKTDWFQKLWKAVWGGIKSFLSETWDGIKAVFSAIGSFFTETIPGWANSLKTKVNNVWTAVKNGVSSAWNAIKEFISTRINNIKTNVSTVFDAVKNKISGVWTSIKNAASSAWNWVKDFITGRINNTRTNVSNAVDGVKSKISGVWSTIKSVTSGAWDWIKSKISGAIDSARNAVVSAVGRISSTVSGIKSAVTGALTGAGSWLKEAGGKIIQGLIDGVTGMIGSLKEKFNSVTDMIPDWKGPMDVDMRLLTPSGQAIMQGLEDGIEGKIPSLKTTLGGVTQTIQGSQAGVDTGAPLVGASAASAPSYGDIYVTIPARDIAEMKGIHDFFAKIQQTARAGKTSRAVAIAR